MMKRSLRILSVSFIPVCLLLPQRLFAETTDVIASHGIWWKLAEPAETGTFVTGDPRVAGPVKIIGIKNTLSSPDYEPRKGQHGSMVNPLTGPDRFHPGYEPGLNTCRESLNAGLPNGKPVSPENPLSLEPGSSLVSTVSWLYNSPEDMEPGNCGTMRRFLIIRTGMRTTRKPLRRAPIPWGHISGSSGTPIGRTILRCGLRDAVSGVGGKPSVYLMLLSTESLQFS